MVLNNMAIVARYEGNFSQATLFYRQCLAIYRDLKDERRICAVLNNLGGALNDAGDYADALPLLEESLRLHRARADESGEATALYNLGDGALLCNRLDDAEKRCTESLCIFFKLGGGKGIVSTLTALATVHVASERFTSAARLLSAASYATEQTAAALSPATQARFDKTVMALKQALNRDAFDLAWHEGQTTSLADIIAGLLGTAPNDH